MSRRNAAGAYGAPKASSPLVKALLSVASFEAVPLAWRPIDDVVDIIHTMYNLPRTMVVTSALLNQQVMVDRAINACVDSRDFNFCGVFRDKFKNNRMFYLCKPGECPPKPPPGEIWHQRIDSASKIIKWRPDPHVVEAFALTSIKYEELRGELKEFLTKMSNKKTNPMPKKRKSETGPSKVEKEPNIKSKKLRAGVTFSTVRLLLSNDQVLVLDIGPDLAKMISLAIIKQSKVELAMDMVSQVLHHHLWLWP